MTLITMNINIKLVQFTKLQSTEMQSRLHLCVMHYTVLLTSMKLQVAATTNKINETKRNNSQINKAESIYFATCFIETNI